MFGRQVRVPLAHLHIERAAEGLELTAHRRLLIADYIARGLDDRDKLALLVDDRPGIDGQIARGCQTHRHACRR